MPVTIASQMAPLRSIHLPSQSWPAMAVMLEMLVTMPTMAVSAPR